MTRPLALPGILRAGLCAAMVSLGACSVLPKAETLTVYRLPDASSTANASTSRPDLPLALRVLTPYSNQMIDSERILVLPENSQISAYGGARWTDPAPVLLRNRLTQALRSEGGFRYVTAGRGQLDADLEMDGDLTAFQVEYENGLPVVHVRLDAVLLQPSTSKVVATRYFETTQPVQGDQVPQVVAAFGLAVDQLAQEVVTWTRQRATPMRR